MIDIKEHKRIARHKRIRKKVSGSKECPRLCVHRSSKNLYAVLVDDVSGKVLMGKSTLAKDLKSKVKNGGNVDAATVLGEGFAKEMLEKKIKRVNFDRGGYLFHGRVKAFAEAVRKAGLEF